MKRITNDKIEMLFSDGTVVACKNLDFHVAECVITPDQWNELWNNTVVPMVNSVKCGEFSYMAYIEQPDGKRLQRFHWYVK